MKENVLKCKVEEFLNRAVKLSEIETDKGKEYWKGQINILNVILSFIDTLEVKEVDLDYIRKELDELIRFIKPDGNFGWGTLYNVATHFFELGVNTSNPLTWEDVKLIWTIGDEIPYMPEEDFFKELLKRFKAQKEKEV